VEDLVEELCSAYRVRRLVFESWQGAASTQSLQKRLNGVSVSEQFPHRRERHASGGLYSLIANRRLVVFPRAELRRELLGWSLSR